jgi:hypothetical protein
LHGLVTTCIKTQTTGWHGQLANRQVDTGRSIIGRARINALIEYYRNTAKCLVLIVKENGYIVVDNRLPGVVCAYWEHW